MNRNAILRKIYSIRVHLKLSVAISVAAVLLSFLVRYYSPITLSYVSFYPAILLATVVAGPLIAMAATILSAALVAAFLNPLGPFAMTDGDIWSLGAFLTVNLLIIATTDFLLKTVIQSNDRADRLIAADQHTHVLLRELSHRMKNQYAVILAMSRATAKTATSVSEYQHTFTQRLHGLSRTHDILVESDWKSVPIEDLISIEMEAVSTKGPLSVLGPPLNLTPTAAVNLGMALHELITNSVQHGAWATNLGDVKISWRYDSTNFYLDWHETGEPAVEELGPKGFGRNILESVVPVALEGSSQLTLQEDGLHWHLRVPAKVIMAED